MNNPWRNQPTYSTQAMIDSLGSTECWSEDDLDAFIRYTEELEKQGRWLCGLLEERAHIDGLVKAFITEKNLINDQ